MGSSRITGPSFNGAVSAISIVSVTRQAPEANSTHSSVGIVLGQSNHTNGMIFWDPVTQRMNVSADYKLGPDASIGIHFPTVIYDGQISPMVLRGGMHSGKEPFPPGSTVQVELEGDYYTDTVKSVPIGTTLPNYHILFPESPETIQVTQSQLSAPGEPVFPMVKADHDKTADDSMPMMPDWIKDNTHISI
jgi:hypothetical protein